MSSTKRQELRRYSACDIADALLKLQVPGAGFLPDIIPMPHRSSTPILRPEKVMAPAATFFMTSKATASFPNPTPPENDAWRQSSVGSNASPYADCTHEDSIVVISQPPGQACAVVGGIMGARMKHRGVQGIVVDGRIRDLVSLAETGLPVWSKGTSVVGAGAETKFQAWDCPLRIGETIVKPGDLVLMDPLENGVVVIPQDKVDEVLELLPKLVAADEKVFRDVEAGVSVADAFMRHRHT